MKSILSLKKIYYNDYVSKINTTGMFEEDIEQAKKRCMAVAEAKAFIDTVVPPEHRSLTIFDFKGKTTAEKPILTIQEAIRAKNLVCKYIWGYSWQELKKKFGSEEDVKKYISTNSVLQRRLANGNNVAIYGGDNGPCGRTMVASIIMKEAIKMRLFTPDIISQTYDWVDFGTLVQELFEGSEYIPHYRTADWLVVDNICLKTESDNQRTFKTDMLDPFFMYRLKNNLPTILVFQYDIRSQLTPLYKTLGVGVSNIVNNQRVCRIPLRKRN